MQIKEATDIVYGSVSALEVWSGVKRVWSRYEYNWIATSINTRAWTDIAFGNNTFVVVGNNNYSYSTNNGSTWSTAIDLKPTTTPETYNAITYGSNGWVLIEGRGYSPYTSENFYTTTNPANGWTQNTLSHPFTAWDWKDVIYSSYYNRYIAIGNPVFISSEGKFLLEKYNNLIGLSSIVCMYSNDGYNWLSGNLISSSNPTLGYDGIVEGIKMPYNRLVAAGVGGVTKLGYSDDGGITWQTSNYSPSIEGYNLRTDFTYTQVAYGYDSPYLPLSGRYVAVCSSSPSLSAKKRVVYSDDGIDWRLANDVDANEWKSIIFANGRFISVSRYNVSNETSNLVMTSRDGINWSSTPLTNNTSNDWVDLSCSSNIIVACANAGTNRIARANFLSG
jgi:hypothetical protein